MYTICYIVFFVLSTSAAFKNDKGNYRHAKTVHSAAFITACSHTTKMQKNSNFDRNYFMGGNFGSEGGNHSLKRGNYCRLNYYLEKNIAVLCYTNRNCLFPLPYHYIISFTGSFINAIAPDFEPFSLIKRYSPCIFLIYI